MTDFDDLVKRIDATLDDEVALLMTPAPQLAIEPAEVAVERVVEIARRWEDMPKLPDKIKLTRDEWDWLKANPPPDPPPGLLDVPVELVDNPEESTLYRPPRSLDFLLAEADEVDRLVIPGEHYHFPFPAHPRLPADCPEPLRPVPPAYVRFDDPPEPQPERMRGWLASLFERWFG